MTIKTSIDFFTTAFEKFKKHFDRSRILSISNLLWQLIVNEAYDNKIICFHPVNSKDEPIFYEIGIVAYNEAGYKRTGVMFLNGTDYEKACEVCDQMNEFLFGMNPQLCNKLVSLSMTKSTS